MLAQRTGDVVLTYYAREFSMAFAVCLNGPGSEGGVKTCYVKFGAARAGVGAGDVSTNCSMPAKRLRLHVAHLSRLA